MENGSVSTLCILSKDWAEKVRWGQIIEDLYYWAKEAVEHCWRPLRRASEDTGHDWTQKVDTQLFMESSNALHFLRNILMPTAVFLDKFLFPFKAMGRVSTKSRLCFKYICPLPLAEVLLFTLSSPSHLGLLPALLISPPIPLKAKSLPCSLLCWHLWSGYFPFLTDSRFYFFPSDNGELGVPMNFCDSFFFSFLSFQCLAWITVEKSEKC